MIDPREDFLEDEPDKEIVHWMDARPLGVSTVGVTTAMAGAFAVGVLSTVGLLFLTGRLRR
jgi:hypothetical protein